MFETKKLQQFLLSGYVKSAVDTMILRYNDDGYLAGSFISDDKVVMGRIVSQYFTKDNPLFVDEYIVLSNIENALKKIGNIYKTFEVIENKSGATTIDIRSGIVDVSIPLLTKEQAPNIPEVNSEILALNRSNVVVDVEFIKSFYKLSKTIKDCNYLYVDIIDNVKLTVAKIKSSDENVSFELDSDGDLTGVESKFDVNYFKTIMYNNRYCDKCKITFYGNLLMELNFEYPDMQSQIFIIAE
jgi:hypothetical protein